MAVLSEKPKKGTNYRGTNPLAASSIESCYYCRTSCLGMAAYVVRDSVQVWHTLGSRISSRQEVEEQKGLSSCIPGKNDPDPHVIGDKGTLTSWHLFQDIVQHCLVFLDSSQRWFWLSIIGWVLLCLSSCWS